MKKKMNRKNQNLVTIYMANRDQKLKKDRSRSTFCESNRESSVAMPSHRNNQYQGMSNLDQAIQQVARNFNRENPMESLSKKNIQDAATAYLYKTTIDKNNESIDADNRLRKMSDVQNSRHARA